MERAGTKATVYNIIRSRESGTRGHKYGFAADMRLRYWKQETRRIKADMKTDDFKGWKAAFRRRNKETWEFQTVRQGRLYHVTVTPGEAGYVVVQRAEDPIKGEVVAIFLKMTNQVLINKYQARNYHALRQEAVK
jgi:hypothetical protein